MGTRPHVFKMHSLQQSLKARLSPERVINRVDAECGKRHLMLGAPALEPVERLFRFSQTEMHHRKTGCGNIALAGTRVKPFEHAARTVAIPRKAKDLARRGE